MKYFELDKEEKQIIRDLDKGEFVSVKNFKSEKERLAKYARYTLEKKANINIRLSRKTLQKLKARAAVQGIPYQTLVSSILHRYTFAG